MQAQLGEIKANQPADNSAAVSDLKRSTSAHYVDINNRLDAQTRVGLDNGRLTIASADGNFTLALRSLVQFDYGYFSQGKNPASVDLNSGSNFRRAQFGFVGTAWKDWSYNFTYDFGGQGVEKNGYIYYAYLQYDGLGPFHIRGGAIAPFEGIEDSTGSGDLLFLERPAAADNGRNVAGGQAAKASICSCRATIICCRLPIPARRPPMPRPSTRRRRSSPGLHGWRSARPTSSGWLMATSVTSSSFPMLRPTPMRRTSSASATGRS